MTSSSTKAVYRSESDTGFRNRAIAWLLKNSGVLDGDPMAALENYFRQCAISVTCRDLAFMAATLANNGVHPVTGKRAVPAEDVAAVLSVMATCGMYDYAGSWFYDVGLPAKSGVSGGIIAVMPGRFGIAVYSPPLDENGNSVRGLAVCRQLARDFKMHTFGLANSPSLVVCRTYSALEAPSRRVRSATAAARLQELAMRIKCFTLQGDVAFDGAEFVVRKSDAADARSRQFHPRHESGFPSDGQRRQRSSTMWGADCGARVRRSCIPGIRGKDRHRGSHCRRTLAREDGGFLSFEDNDVATEWCENRLLEAETGETVMPLSIKTLADFPMFADMPGPALSQLEGLVEAVDFEPGRGDHCGGAVA